MFQLQTNSFESFRRVGFENSGALLSFVVFLQTGRSSNQSNERWRAVTDDGTNGALKKF